MKRKRVHHLRVPIFLATGVLVLVLAAIWAKAPGNLSRFLKKPPIVEQVSTVKQTIPDLILSGAREEVKRKTRYDASYQSIGYPNGDVAPERGACTDIIIRALRAAGFDLQLLIHKDMVENFYLYPQLWGLNKPDPNIDHRRTQNQRFYLERFGESLTLETTETDLPQWKHGDLVYWRFPSGQEHTGVISNRINKKGIPLVIHNSAVAREEDCLLRWKIIGHYRFPGNQQ